MPPIDRQGKPKSCVRIQGLGSKVTKKTRDPTNFGLPPGLRSQIAFLSCNLTIFLIAP